MRPFCVAPRVSPLVQMSTWLESDGGFCGGGLAREWGALLRGVWRQAHDPGPGALGRGCGQNLYCTLVMKLRGAPYTPQLST